MIMKSMRSVLIVLFLLMLSSFLGAQQKFALVIGNGSYTQVTKLNNPVNDANDMTAALEGLGFKVDLITDATLRAMNDGVDRFRQNLASSAGAYGFFFYAGHGVQSAGNNYLIPVDAAISSESNLRYNAMMMQQVLDNIEEAGNALNVVVLDACRDNPFSWARSSNRGLSVLPQSPPGSIVVFATSANRTAADGTGRNGLFTSQLLKNLKTPGLEVKELFNRVGQDVLIASNKAQLPEVSIKFFETAYLGTPPAVAAPAQLPVSSPAAPQIGTVTDATGNFEVSVVSAGNVEIRGEGLNEKVPPAAVTQRTTPDGFVHIPGGTFTMGSPASEANRDSNEVQHQVTVSSFYLGKYEVTQKEYQAVTGSNPSYFKGDNLPVEQVSWNDAVNYCNTRSITEGLTPAYTISGENVTWNRVANGYRLPTEAEWEYACRAGTSTAFNTGNNITTSQANYDGNYPYNNNDKGTYREKTTAVGSFSPNAWGLYDMHGNVWEWCWDWYGTYSAAAQSDPSGLVGPASPGMNRVNRGGSWYIGAQNLRSAIRDYFIPSHRDYYLGFRLARSQ
jgi:formylglycine-generating enzyme required for sulfatase activity